MRTANDCTGRGSDIDVAGETRAALDGVVGRIARYAGIAERDIAKQRCDARALRHSHVRRCLTAAFAFEQDETCNALRTFPNGIARERAVRVAAHAPRSEQ